MLKGEVRVEPPDQMCRTFGEVARHRVMGDIIRRYSTNRADIYRLALDGIQFTHPLHVLDLGCGYGAFTAALDGVAPRGSIGNGVDWIEDNRKPYLRAARAAGMEGRFICGPASAASAFPDGSFDLIMAGFSLYFFAEMLPEIRRLLAADGVFVTITHSENTLRELLGDIRAALGLDGELSPEGFGIEVMLEAFNAENGRERLAPYFGEVTVREYPNQLRFPTNRLEDCFAYVDFKRGTVTPDSPYRDRAADERSMRSLYDVIRTKAARTGFYTLTKDDAIFSCRRSAR